MTYTNEQIKLAHSCKNANELIRLAKDNNVSLTQSEADGFFACSHTTGELSDNELESVSGGCNDSTSPPKCTSCGSTSNYLDTNTGIYHCYDCGKLF